MVKKKHEKMLTILAIKEMQIETTQRFHLTPVRTATIKNTTTKNIGEDARKKEPLCTAGGDVT
jgi:hypothetical protein